MSVQTGEACTVYVFPRSPVSELEHRIYREYREMPAMRLRPEQAARLWSVDRTTCQQALDNLVKQGFLQRDETGCYARANGGY